MMQLINVDGFLQPYRAAQRVLTILKGHYLLM